MRFFIGILLVIGFCFSFASANPLDRRSSMGYELVYVQAGDTVWNIAGRHTRDREDIREVVLLIRQMNRLNNSAEVFVGQTLKVPLR
jgi:nucleoid-associated protein YgaU